MTELERALSLAKELDALTKDNPSILRFVEAVEAMNGKAVIPMEREQLIGASAVKKMLGITDSTLIRLVKEGHIPYVVLPGNIKRQYRLSDVNSFIRNLGGE